jgi:hypothetical membrane protein
MNTVAAPVHLPLVRTSWSALAGLVGPVLFSAVFVAQGLARPDEYDPVSEPVSALEAGPNGWIQQVNFLVFAVLLAVFALGLHRAIAPTRRGWLGPAFLGLACAGLVLAAAIPLRQDSAGETYDPGGHFVAGVLFFLSSSLAFVALSRRCTADPRWRGLASYTLVAGLCALAGFVLLGRFVIPDGAPLHEYAGLAQRAVLWLVTFPCLLALAWRMRRLSQRP